MCQYQLPAIKSVIAAVKAVPKNVATFFAGVRSRVTASYKRLTRYHVCFVNHRKWVPGIPAHGPQTWPWWRLVSLGMVSMAIHLPSTGKRLWVYTRWGAVYFEFVADRRGAY